MFRFDDPLMFLLLLVIPVLILVYLRKKGNLSIKYSSIKQIKRIYSVSSSWSKYLLFSLRLIAILLLITALARPQIHQKWVELKNSGVDIMLVLDTSGSMETPDYNINGFPTNRLNVVKDVVDKFILKRPTDRIGMVVFGTDAFTQCPLTLDHEILATFLKDIRIGMVGESTGIGDAIGIAVKRIKDIKAKSKIIILLTDGRSNVGQLSPITAASVAKTYGIKIYTIGVGSKEISNFSMLQVAQGASAQEIALDEDTLKAIAETTGGMYFRAMDTAGLNSIYDTIDKMEKTERKIKEYGKNIELFGGFLFLALLIFAVEFILGNTVFAKVP